MKNFFRNNASIFVWVVFGLVVGFSFWQVDQSRQQSRQQICQSQLDAALTLRDLIDFSLAANPSPEAQEIVQKFYDRIEVPPAICEGTGIDVSEFFDRTSTTTTPPP